METRITQNNLRVFSGLHPGSAFISEGRMYIKVEGSVNLAADLRSGALISISAGTKVQYCPKAVVFSEGE